ncbi:MAG: phosphoribosylamine--glycine ligase [Alphaproteobacteria bacterium]|nr:phosphoribosylamine--glycine ligase [Alphaproteobacteria bacterium]
MEVLVVGSGGREHALCWKLAASPLCTKLYCAPGNAGIADEAECVAIGAADVDALVDFAKANTIDLVVVGPEAPLVGGLVDRLDAEGILAFGPTADAAILEGSKGFMKDLCANYGIPTADYGRFTDAGAAKAFVRQRGAPIVVKADGLATGKGVILCDSIDEAETAIDQMMGERMFGAAGDEVVIEELLVGEEVSFIALVDGETVLPLASSQDHKAVGDGDTGRNTGGMGAYSPAPVVDDALADEIMARVMRPTVEAMKAEGRRFKGVLYAGLMITADGPRVLEFNVRFGDPECQPLMMRMMSDLLPALVASAEGVLDRFDLRWYPDAALCVVMATRGYPGAYDKGSEIRGLDRLSGRDDVAVFHAGTTAKDGRILAAGGRVLGVTALGADVAEAQRQAYAAIDMIDWPQGFCRRDIGWRAIGRQTP